MKLFDNEQLITNSGNYNEVILTTKRIRQTENGRDLTSIMLEKISSIVVKYQSFMLLLLFGIIATIVGLFLLNEGDPRAMFAFVAGGILILFYFLTRKHIISISSDGGAKIIIVTKGISTESVHDFVHKIELAKMEVHQSS